MVSKSAPKSHHHGQDSVAHPTKTACFGNRIQRHCMLFSIGIPYLYLVLIQGVSADSEIESGPFIYYILNLSDANFPPINLC